ncbi:MAG: hypothetical protein GVY19_07160 [Bacteroidetes bacterium]|jgi:hypothetical protein|nr:hypothetical protein [Bacteroidota bacterium]
MITRIKKGSNKDEIREKLDNHQTKSPKKHIDLEKYCGAIKLKEDPLVLQKKWRNEWE